MFPWPAETGQGNGHLLAWLNAELMNNAAEIGQLSLIRCAPTSPADRERSPGRVESGSPARSRRYPNLSGWGRGRTSRSIIGPQGSRDRAT